MIHYLTEERSLVLKNQALRLLEQGSFTPPLMQRAALIAAQSASQLVSTSKTIYVLAGPGNNGGDALYTAAYLKQMGYFVRILVTTSPDHLNAECLAGYQLAQQYGVEIQHGFEFHLPAGCGLMIDGLFGIGLSKSIRSPYVELIEQMNRHRSLYCLTLALDVPSGIESDTGRILGVAVRADYTLTFLGLKPGLLTADGRDASGKIWVHDLFLPAEKFDTFFTKTDQAGSLNMVSSEAWYKFKRVLNSHKGLFGNVGVIGGAPSMQGAAILSGRAALKLGAGRVFVSASGCEMDFHYPELMFQTDQMLLQREDLTCLVLGMGLGQSPAAKKLLIESFKTQKPLILDADGLRLLAECDTLCVRDHQAVLLLTPHPAEAAALLDSSVAQIQADRLAAAKALASKYQAWVILKGMGSICMAPNGKWWINQTGNPGLSSAGMGDTLAGVIGALFAQTCDMTLAMRLGVYLHGLAADQLVSQGVGPIGLTASELIDQARKILNQLVYTPSN